MRRSAKDPAAKDELAKEVLKHAHTHAMAEAARAGFATRKPTEFFDVEEEEEEEDDEGWKSA